MTRTLSHAKVKLFNHSWYLDIITCNNATKTLITQHVTEKSITKSRGNFQNQVARKEYLTWSGNVPSSIFFKNKSINKNTKMS